MNRNTLFRYWPSQYLQIVDREDIPAEGEEMAETAGIPEGAPLSGEGSTSHDTGVEKATGALRDAEGLETPGIDVREDSA